MDLGGASNCATQQQLPTALQLHILSFLCPNDRALSGRLVSPDTADALSGPQNCTAFLSQPLPAHAVPWFMEAGQQHMRQLASRHKLHLLCTAAASGSEGNLEAALALLQPSIFPELLQHWISFRGPYLATDLGVTAVKAGHPQLLGWLLRRCPGRLRPGCVLQAAAQHCDLAGLRSVYEALKDHDKRSDGGSGSLVDRLGCPQLILDAAAKSATPDSPEKMQWLMSTLDGSCRVQESTAVAAARCGDLGRLRWLHSVGCPMDDLRVLETALEHADLAVAQWLVDEAGCSLAADGTGGTGWTADWAWEDLLAAAVKSADGVGKLAWLRERGGPSPTADLIDDAVKAGQVGVASFLLQGPGAASVLQARGHVLAPVAVLSGSIPTVELLWKAGVVFTHDAYRYGRVAGSLPMVRWLTCHTEVPAVGLGLYGLIISWPGATPAHSRDLLEAVQLMADRAGHCVPPTDYRRALKTAAERGDLALVQCLLQHRRLLARSGFRPDEEILTAAAQGGCEPLLEWLAEQHPGCLALSGNLQTPYDFTARSGDRDTLEALRRLGVPWGTDRAVAQALSVECQFSAARWLVEQGAPVGGAGHMDISVALGLREKRLSAEEAAWLRGLAPARAAQSGGIGERRKGKKKKK